jgi:lipoyl(octanoyl) transferase
MALDEALLRSALERKIASLRFYTWTGPTLSLGYFQPHAEREIHDVAWVRRPTGGDAILHHLEITYCLALPVGRSWHNSESWLCRFHHAVAAALAQFRISARSVVCGEEKRLGPYLCFQHQTPGDLLIDGHKVVGSAQRRPHEATMQHGSILLNRSPHAPAISGICDISGRKVKGPELERAIVTELANATGWAFEPSEWTLDERVAALELERDKYGTAAWNEKR